MLTTTLDKGHSTPRFLRMSAYAMPCTYDLAETCNVPLGFILQPFADQLPEEEPVPLATFNDQPPPRCDHCGGYINPWVAWSASGQSWVCNLCETSNPGRSRQPAPSSNVDVLTFWLHSRPRVLLSYRLQRPTHGSRFTPRAQLRNSGFRGDIEIQRPPTFTSASSVLRSDARLDFPAHVAVVSSRTPRSNPTPDAFRDRC